VDDSPLNLHQLPDDRGDLPVDHWLKTMFHQMMSEPVPARFLDLVEHLDNPGGL